MGFIYGNFSSDNSVCPILHHFCKTPCRTQAGFWPLSNNAFGYNRILNLIFPCHRPERFLQLCSDDPEYFPPEDEEFAVKQLSSINMIVANCSTPANYAHMLRRQIKLPFRKPLVVMTPKSLLRLPECKSSFDDLLPGTEFKRMILDNGPASENPAAVQKILFCTGKVYYDLLKERKDAGLEDKIAIHTIEQICPFPFDIMKKV